MSNPESDPNKEEMSPEVYEKAVAYIRDFVNSPVDISSWKEWKSLLSMAAFSAGLLVTFKILRTRFSRGDADYSISKTNPLLVEVNDRDRKVMMALPTHMSNLKNPHMWDDLEGDVPIVLAGGEAEGSRRLVAECRRFFWTVAEELGIVDQV